MKKSIPILLAVFVGAFLWRLLVAKAGVLDMDLQKLSNFSPLLSLAFIGAVVLPKRLAIWLPIALVIVADLIVAGGRNWGGAYWYAAPVAYGCFALAGWWGLRQRGSREALPLLLKMATCSIGFFLVTNSLCWALDGAYAKTFGGLVQCLTVGKPGFLPTWVFLRNSLCGDLLFGALLILVFNRQPATAPERRIRLLGAGA